MSGGRATRGLARGENLSRQAGDISSVSPEGHALTNRFYIELKHYADLALTRFYTEQKGTLAVFWLKTKREAEKHGRMPMMIVKQNRVPTLLIAPIGQVTKISSSAQFMTRYARLGSLMCEVYLFDDVLKRSFAL